MHRPRYIQDALYIGRSSGASSTPPDRGTSPWAEGKEFSPCSVGDGGTPPPAAKRQAVASPRDTVGRGLGDGERSGVKPARSSGMADMLAWAEDVEHSAAGQARSAVSDDDDPTHRHVGRSELPSEVPTEVSELSAEQERQRDAELLRQVLGRSTGTSCHN